jgi:peptidoglycan/LPS O-acetylase OafA/YrhL
VRGAIADKEQVGPGPEVEGARRRFVYHPSLDGVRAVAMFAVFANHSGRKVFYSGYYGVDVFFALSGFLITTLLLQEYASSGRISLKLFWSRRAARLLPALFLACLIVLATSLLGAVAPHQPVLHTYRLHTALVGIACAIGYVSSWVQGLTRIGVGSLTHTWSLSVEEWFYALWPPLLVLCLRRPQWATRIVVGSAVLAMVYRLVSERFISSGSYLYFAPDQHACQLLAGCALGLLLVNRTPDTLPSRRALSWTGLLGAGAVVFLMARPIGEIVLLGHQPPYTWGDQRGGMVLIALASVAMLASIVTVPESRLARALSHPVLVWTGKRTYGLYLYHVVILELVAPPAIMNGPVSWRGGLVALVIIFLIADASYRWVEQPAIRWMRDRERRIRTEARVSGAATAALRALDGRPTSPTADAAAPL